MVILPSNERTRQYGSAAERGEPSSEGRNFVTPYDFMGQQHDYMPDYLAHLCSGAVLILEVKGQEVEEDRAMYAAARRWAKRVTRWGEMGRWEFAIIRDPSETQSVLNALST